MESFFKGLWVFVLCYGATYMAAIINYNVEEMLFSKIRFKKTISIKLKEIFLSYLRASTSHKEALINLIPRIPIILAITLIPNVVGDIYWNPKHSMWVFLALWTLANLLGFIKGLIAKTPIDNVRVEKSMAIVVPLAIFIFVIVGTTGQDQVAEILKYQQDKGPLIFKQFPVFIVLGLLWFISIEHIVGEGFFSKVESRIKLSNQFDKAVWLMLFSVVFLGATSWDIYLKAVLINTIGTILFGFFYKLRLDQEEKFILWEITPITLLTLIISLVIIGFY
ncbi:MAG: hypothetical protein IPM57_04380 [Oligoflexia bacterium]|nr:hypothetical protein [Oligoflexia bacterium]